MEVLPSFFTCYEQIDWSKKKVITVFLIVL